MNRKLFFLAILLVLAFASLPCALAQTQEVGVKMDDLFVYAVSETVNGQTSSWTKGVRVTSVSGTMISVTDTDAFENGTEDSWYQNTYEVSTSASNPYFFFANLNVSDPVYVTNKGTVSVNTTISRSYASGNRETNYIKYTDLNNEDVTIETYFDKQTGILVESTQTDSSTNHEMHITLKDTTVWTVTESPTETPTPSQPAAQTPNPTSNTPTPPYNSATSTPAPGIFLSFETLYVILAVIAIVVAATVLAVALKRRKK